MYLKFLNTKCSFYCRINFNLNLQSTKNELIFKCSMLPFIFKLVQNVYLMQITYIKKNLLELSEIAL